jgi:hypothetical protein
MGSASKDNSTLDLYNARLAVLEKQVEFLLKLNGLNLSRFKDADDEELLRVYRDTVQMLGVSDERIPLEHIEQWSEVFLQISEVEVVRLQPIVEIMHTWEPFYLLCQRMMTHVRTHPKLDISLRTQQLYATLDKGIRGLRAIGAIMLKKHPEGLSRKGTVLLHGSDLRPYL